MNPFSLQGKLILITGASSGIGQQCAITCSQMGATIVGFGRDSDRLEETRRQMINPENHNFTSVDITDHEVVEQAISHAVSLAGKFHGVIHSAGISETLPLRMIKMKKLDEIFQINVAGSINLARLLTRPANLSDSGGSFVFITSVMATVGESGKSLYALTKGAVLAAAKSLAIELAPRKIRVNCVSPGVVVTPMSKKSFYSQNAEALDYVTKLHPLGLGEPTDVAGACVFLLSDAARWVTGSNIMVDGGYSAR